ncbi:hypothetical protein EAOG_00618 [Escherichia coli R527]|nr:hypothetical protein EAOG_00618 [Escherichia coli R527]OSK42539.1 hypothetical protein EAHG_02009 [Escherichia coli B671]OSK52218.1 hypothetical protein EAGG_01231 [Escherichia coli H588]OSL07474.1 hypothetical protein ECUG_01896 [Escherichia coli H296]OSL44324.1 hypothetical protein EARG_00104 [Escherichia coli H461]OSL78529.1 hypothetical protein EAYG_01180 [Escherichia coli TA014]
MRNYLFRFKEMQTTSIKKVTKEASNVLSINISNQI